MSISKIPSIRAKARQQELLLHRYVQPARSTPEGTPVRWSLVPGLSRQRLSIRQGEAA